MLFARPQTPTEPIADRPADTTTKDPSRVRPNRYRQAVHQLDQVPGPQPPTSQSRARGAGSSSFRQPIFRQQLNLRLQLLDALGQVVDQLALWIGKSAVLQIVAARVQSRPTHPP